MTLLTDVASKPERNELNGRQLPEQLENPSTAGNFSRLTDDQLFHAFPALTKPHKVTKALRMTSLLPDLLKSLLLIEEVRRTGGDLQQLKDWRRQRWGSRVDQAFVLQRKRFERASYFQLVLNNQGEATEYYHQLCNQEIHFEELLQQRHPPKSNKPPKGYMLDKLLQSLPKELAKKLRRAQPGVPISPVVVGKTTLLLQLIELHEPELDQSVRELLEQEIEQQWLNDELKRRLETIEATEHPSQPTTPE